MSKKVLCEEPKTSFYVNEEFVILKSSEDLGDLIERYLGPEAKEYYEDILDYWKTVL